MADRLEPRYDLELVYRAIYQFLLEYPLERSESEEEASDIWVALGEIAYPEDNVQNPWPKYAALAGKGQRNAWDSFVLVYAFLRGFTYTGCPGLEKTSAKFVYEMRKVISDEDQEAAIYKTWLECLVKVRNKVPWSNTIIRD